MKAIIDGLLLDKNYINWQYEGKLKSYDFYYEDMLVAASEVLNEK